MPDSFIFYSEASLVRNTPFVADSLPSLLDCLHRVSGASIFFHFYHSLLRRHFLKAEHQNDFARWADLQLREPALAEQLVTVDPMEFQTVRAARERLIEYVAAYVGPTQTFMRVAQGAEFRFQESQSFTYPSGLVAHDLEGFARAVRRISIRSIFYHVVEARLRLDDGTNDFSSWLEHSWGEGTLARRIEQLNPYRYGLADLRVRISELTKQRLQK